MTVISVLGRRTTPLQQRIVEAARGNGPELVASLATVLALLLGLYQLDRRSFWLDEATTFYVSGVSWERLLEIFLGAEGGWHPPTYFVALKLWRALFGDDQVALRGMSVFFASAAIPATFLLTRRLAGDWTAAAGSVFLACNGFFIRYAQEARTYTLLVLLAVVSYWLLVRALERTSVAPWLAYGAITALGIYAHLFFAFIVAVQALALLFPALRPRAWEGPLVALTVVGVAAMPLLMGSLGASSSVLDWVAPIRWEAVDRGIVALSGETSGTLVAYAAGLLLAIAWMMGAGSGWKWAPLLVLWTLSLPVAVATASLIKPMFVLRYLIMSLPALVILVAVGITRLPAWAAGVLCWLIVVVSLFGVSDWYRSIHPEWREAAAALQSMGGPRDGVILWTPRARKPLSFQVEQLPSARSMPQLVTPPVPWTWNSYGRSDPPLTDAGERFERCEFRRIWVVSGPRTVDPHAEHPAARVLGSAYEARERVRRLSGVRVQLFVRDQRPCPDGD